MLLTAIQDRTPAIPLPLLRWTTLCTAVRNGSGLSMEQSSRFGEAVVPRDGGHTFEQGHQAPEILDGYLSIVGGEVTTLVSEITGSAHPARLGQAQERSVASSGGADGGLGAPESRRPSAD